MIVAEEFVDVETAKHSGRTAFRAMLDYLTKHRATCRTILVEAYFRGMHARFWWHSRSTETSWSVER
jgi:hypothetical protein